ncbi:hypothetical protein VTO73DRAFT_8631 [Trametes versicolor]
MSPPSTAAPPSILALLPPVPSLGNTFGAFLIATFLGLIMYGLTVHQTYRYFRLFPRDAPVLKGIVASTLVLETIHTVLCMHVCYYYLVTEYFNPLALLDGVWSIRISPVSTAAVILISESFFVRRVYLIGARFRAILIVIPVLMLANLGFATAATVEAFILPTFADFANVAWLTSAGFGCAVLIDSLLTGTLIFVLHKSRTGLKATDSLIDVLIIYAVNTGLLTVIVSILSLILALVLPKDLIYSGFNIIATKLYANSLLAVLNSRNGIVDRVPQDCFDTGTLNLSVLKDRNGDTTAQTHLRLPKVNVGTHSPGAMLEIRVDTERAVRGDTGSIETEHKGLEAK